VKCGAAAWMDRHVSDVQAFVRFDITTGEDFMSTLEIETEIKKTVQATDAVRMIDCGRASERTQGVPLLLLFELGTPPTNKLYLV
jgi:hypothetical protein